MSYGEAQVVRERHDYGQGYTEEAVGFRIGDRIWWVAMRGYGHNTEEFARDNGLCHEIVRRWNANRPRGGADS